MAIFFQIRPKLKILTYIEHESFLLHKNVFNWLRNNKKPLISQQVFGVGEVSEGPGYSIAQICRDRTMSS